MWKGTEAKGRRRGGGGRWRKVLWLASKLPAVRASEVCWPEAGAQCRGRRAQCRAARREPANH